RAATASEWGIAGRPFLASLRAATAFTIAAGGPIALVGWLRGSWHSLPMTATEAAVPFGWTLGQPFALQIVFLRESQGAVRRRAGVALAAVLFAALHLPNPFLTLATCIAALAWCAIYDRHPNILPLALSHMVLTALVLAALDDSATGRLRVGIAYLASR